MKSPSKLLRALYRWRVRAGLVFLPAILVVARPVRATVGAGLAVCALGLGIRAWAAGHIKKEKELAVSGPYQYTRNPLYLGNFVLGLSVGSERTHGPGSSSSRPISCCSTRRSSWRSATA